MSCIPSPYPVLLLFNTVLKKKKMNEFLVVSLNSIMSTTGQKPRSKKGF